MATTGWETPWKIIAMTLLGAVVTGAAAWMVFGQDKVTRGEMVDYVQNQAPWIRQRGEIQSTIGQNATAVSDLKTSVEKLVASQHDLQLDLRVLVTKFNAWVESEKAKLRGEGR